MKKIIAVMALAVLAASAPAATVWVDGVLFGNICRAGIYYTIYPMAYAQPVGTLCPVRNAYGNIIAQGIVTDE